MRIGLIVAVLGLAAPASAEPGGRLEAGGFFGIDYFGDNKIALGGSMAPEQRPQNAPLVGGRLTYVPLKLGGDIHLDLGLEGELSFTPSWTGYGFDGPRPSSFAPVIGYRANLLVRLGGGWFQPHVTAGGGGATVTPSSSMLVQDTDSVLQWGVGASLPFGHWQLRFDARQGFTRALGGGRTDTYQLSAAIVARIGVAGKRKVETPPVVVVEPVKPPPPPPDKDTDGDGILDSLDVCPTQPESINGIADNDGCPEPDTDKDGLVGDGDKCPEQAEDFDKFEDEDGCPDPDNDKDGIADAKDNCPDEAETKNGVADTDGCPDKIPDSVITALGAADAVTFETGKARMTPAGKAALDKALPPMLSNKLLRITITVAPEKDGPPEADLAKKRAENVKWYLIDQGIAEGNITTAVGPVRPSKKKPLVFLSLTP